MSSLGLKKETQTVFFTEKEQSFRVGYRSAIQNKGFKAVQSYSSTRELWSDLDEAGNDPSVLMVCLDMDQTLAAGLIQSVRQRKVGKNPFLPIVASSWALGAKGADQALAMGADGYIAKPADASDIDAYMTSVLEKRPPFVAMHNYIGPDRRWIKKRPGLAQRVQAPNVAQMVSARAPQSRIETAIEDAWKNICFVRSVGTAFEIGVKGKLLAHLFTQKHSYEDVETSVTEILSMTAEVQKDLSLDLYKGTSELLVQMADLAQGIKRNYANPLDAYIRFLPLLSEAICQSVRPDMCDDQVSEEIAAWIRRYLTHKQVKAMKQNTRQKQPSPASIPI